ncbi:heat shock protein 9/12-domain-containing protein [Mycena vulgaris]|nr:heat shock protein 9/12-domain-containing protein [Mycena vulgaris]
MSDTGRQSLTDKAGAAIKPDSQKSTTEHVGDKFKGTTDSVASTLQPNSEKTTSQKAWRHPSRPTRTKPTSPCSQRQRTPVGMGEK